MILTNNFYVRDYVLVYLTLFIIGSLLGFLSECLYRRFVSAKKWVNPGFMRGPWLPLYGFGLILMHLISNLFYTYLPDNIRLYDPNGFLSGVASGPTAYDLIPIFIIAISLILLEFIAGVIFVKGFKTRLWDYTNMKGNILGVICPVFSLIWFIITVIYYYALNPFVSEAFYELLIIMFRGGDNGTMVNTILIFIIGIIYGFFIIDLVISLNIFNKLQKLSKDIPGLKHYEDFRASQKAKLLENKAKLASIVPISIKDRYQETKDKLLNETNKFKKFINKIIYIDPNKIDCKDNYDEHGRPIKEKNDL